MITHILESTSSSPPFSQSDHFPELVCLTCCSKDLPGKIWRYAVIIFQNRTILGFAKSSPLSSRNCPRCFLQGSALSERPDELFDTSLAPSAGNFLLKQKKIFPHLLSAATRRPWRSECTRKLEIFGGSSGGQPRERWRSDNRTELAHLSRSPICMQARKPV